MNIRFVVDGEECNEQTVRLRINTGDGDANLEFFDEIKNAWYRILFLAGDSAGKISIHTQSPTTLPAALFLDGTRKP